VTDTLRPFKNFFYTVGDDPDVTLNPKCSETAYKNGGLYECHLNGKYFGIIKPDTDSDPVLLCELRLYSRKSAVPYFTTSSSTVHSGWDHSFPGTIGPHSGDCNLGLDDCFCSAQVNPAYWTLNFGVRTHVTKVVAISDQFNSGWYNNLFDVYLRVGYDVSFENDVACASSPFFPNEPTRGIGFEATCNLLGKNLTVYHTRSDWLNISMIAVFIQCICTGMTFTSPAPVYIDVEASIFGPEVVQSLTEASTTNPSATGPFCSINYGDECPTPFEATLDTLDPLPAFMTLS